jgi:hypothetical protein
MVVCWANKLSGKRKKSISKYLYFFISSLFVDWLSLFDWATLQVVNSACGGKALRRVGVVVIHGLNKIWLSGARLPIGY